MILNSLFPVFALILLGGVLKTTGFVSEAFLKTSDKLVYYIFFPCMLFWKIGSNDTLQGIDLSLSMAALCAVFMVFAVSTAYIIYGRVTDFQAGSFSQSCYRFNTYIGMAVVVNALGDEGVLQFGILIGIVIPVINILSVSILIWFSEKKYSTRQRIQRLAGAVLSNPLILACLAGILFLNTGIGFPRFVHNTLDLISMVTLPLALISIGSAFSFKKMTGYLHLSFMASAFKMILLPLAGVLFMKLFGVQGPAFKVGLIYFCLPTSTALYVLSSQMNSDTELASAVIVFSTLISIIPLSMALGFMV